MKKLLSFWIAVILANSVIAEEVKEAKFGFDGILIGASLKNSPWVYGSELQYVCEGCYEEQKLKGGEIAKLYGFKGLERADVKLRTPRPYEPKIAYPADFLFTQQLSGEVADLDEEIGSLGSAKLLMVADFEAMPRLAKEISDEEGKYKKIAIDYLGIENPQISQLLSVDLDGDGEEEILINAQNIVPTENEDFSFAMDKSLFLKARLRNPLLKNDGDKYSAIFIYKQGKIIPMNEVKIMAGDSEKLKLFKISAIADLNGDGVMEIISTEADFDEFHYRIYEIKEGKANQEPSAVG